MKQVNPQLREYIEKEILPRYADFDKAHRRDHVDAVISQALELASHYDVNIDIVYTAAAYHDTGLCEGRELHHSVSARIIRSDASLRQWLTEEQIDTAADAAEDHRASSKHAPRTIYGRIIAEADRMIVPEQIIRRTIQYGLSHYPELTREQHYQRTLEHMHEKYAEDGYLKLWIPESPNAERLAQLRAIINDSGCLRDAFGTIYDEETKK